MKTSYFGTIPLITDINLPQIPQMVPDQVYLVDSERGRIAVMSQKTWENFGTMCESIRNAMRHIERKMQEQNVELETTRRIHAQLVKQHNHLKETTQAQRRASLQSVFKPGVKAE
jgi:hypothetical protein